MGYYICAFSLALHQVPKVFSSTQFLLIVRLRDTSHSFFDRIAHFFKSDLIG